MVGSRSKYKLASQHITAVSHLLGRNSPALYTIFIYLSLYEANLLRVHAAGVKWLGEGCPFPYPVQMHSIPLALAGARRLCGAHSGSPQL